MKKQDPSFLAFMSRHLVAMCVNYTSFDKHGKPFHHGNTVFSGFVVETHGVWCFATAGHCIRDELDQRVSKKEMRINGVSLADHFGWNAEHSHMIPLPYEHGDALAIYERSSALDFALLPLSNLTRRALEANGVEPIRRANWASQDGLEWEHFKILGFPDHLQQERVDSDGNPMSFVMPTMIAVDRLDPEDFPTESGVPWFVGRIPSDVGIESIVGMSGGPIFGLRRDDAGRWSYHVVALQSSWLEPKRITFGCSLPMFMEIVEAALSDE